MIGRGLEGGCADVHDSPGAKPAADIGEDVPVRAPAGRASHSRAPGAGVGGGTRDVRAAEQPGRCVNGDIAEPDHGPPQHALEPVLSDDVPRPRRDGEP